MLEEVKLNKNAWHVRLHKFVDGKHAPGLKFTNFCPYFWLTILYLITFIPLVIGRFLNKIILGLSSGFNYIKETSYNSIKDKIIEPSFLKSIKNLSEDDIYYLYQLEGRWLRGDISSCASRKERRKIEKWRELNPNWISELAKIKKEKEKERSLRKQTENLKRLNEEKKKRERRLKLVKYTQRMLPIILAIPILGILFIIVKAIISLWKLLITINWLSILMAGSIVLGGILIILAFIFGCSYLQNNGYWDDIIKVIAMPITIPLKLIIHSLGLILKPMKPLGIYIINKIDNGLSKIIEISSFIGIFIKTVKQNHCPHIVWEEGEEHVLSRLREG